MKKVLLTGEALNALYGAEGEKLEVTVEETVETTAKGTETETAGKAAAEGSETEEVETGEDPAAAEFKAQIETLQAELATAQEAITEAEAKSTEAAKQVETLTAELATIKPIVVEHVDRMRTALKLVKVDMSAMDSASLVREYEGTKATFIKAFKVGSHVPEAKDKSNTVEWPQSSHDAAKIKALGF